MFTTVRLLRLPNNQGSLFLIGVGIGLLLSLFAARWEAFLIPREQVPSGNQQEGAAVLRNCQQDRSLQGDLSKNGGFGHFHAAYAWQRERQNQSLYYFERPGRLLPMMRLTEPETNRQHRVAEASSWLRTQSIVIVASVKNALPGLETSLENLSRLRRLFGQSFMVFVENNSVDRTRLRLLQLARSDPRVRVLGCGSLNSKWPCNVAMRYTSGRRHAAGQLINRSIGEEIDRGLIMSALRNQYLDYVYHFLADKADLMLAIDPDVEWRDWDLENITQGLYYFKTRPQLQQLCANTIDIPSNKLFDPCTLAFFNNKRFGEDTVYPSVDYYKSIHRAPWKLPPVKVESCFQGFAFYRVSELLKAQVWYERSHGEWVCEHNTLSRQLREVYLDPQMGMGVLAANIG